MKVLGLITLVVGFLIASTSAEARRAVRHRHVVYHHVHHHFARHYRPLNRRYARAPAGMPGPCYTAARMGGPCGCFAEWLTFHVTNHVWRGKNLWLADEWRRVFPRAEPAPGLAAVWPGRHVAVIAAVHTDRSGKPVSITTRESWGLIRRSLAGLVIVDPFASDRRRPRVRFASGALG